jgi:undecaprenyl-diphosphatase
VGKRRALSLRHAIALGLLHGPTELLPISSSAHTSLVPWLADWPYGELDPALRKSFEVALHAGTAAALLARAPAVRSGGGASFLIGALVPPALAGYTLGEQIERRLGGPATIAAGLLAGSVAMGAAEVHARKGRPTRAVASAGLRDGLALGLAQSLALFPGISRSGATLAAARARGFSRLDADRLSWRVGLPIIAGAAALKGSQLARAGIPREVRIPLAAGAASALLSTFVSTTVLTPRRRVALLPACAAYRAMLALLVVRRMRDNTS